MPGGQRVPLEQMVQSISPGDSVKLRFSALLCHVAPPSSLKTAADQPFSPGSCSRTPPDGSLMVSPFVGPKFGPKALRTLLFSSAYGLLQCRPAPNRVRSS